MGILSWLKQATVGSDGSAVLYRPLPLVEGEEAFPGLRMKEALDAHVQWTHRLERQINGSSDEELEVGTVASDTRCTLGRWIHDQAREHFSGNDEYEELKRIHAEFHLSCGRVLNDTHNGDTDSARNALKSVRFRSGDVQLALVRFYEKHRD